MTNIKFKCIYCEKETEMSDHLCDSCWELKTRIKNNFDIAKKIIEEAGIYSEIDALKIENNRETDIPWDKEYVDSKVKGQVDIQYCKRDFSGIKKESLRIQCKEENKSNTAKNLGKI